MTEAERLIDALGLEPHPEGGWYAETWRADAGAGERAAATAIHYLLKSGERSHWHRVDADELWLWHAGAELTLSVASPKGGPATRHRLGADIASGAQPQALVPKGHWQAAETLGTFTLVSCVVAPGFEFDGFELAPPDFDPAA